jgi:hypothetical protein
MTKTYADNPTSSLDDVFLWADDSWCYRSEYTMTDFGWKSDDFRVLRVGSDEYDNFLREVDASLASRQADLRIEPCSEEQNRKLPF